MEVSVRETWTMTLCCWPTLESRGYQSMSPRRQGEGGGLITYALCFDINF